MYEHYNNIIKYVDELIAYLKMNEIEAEYSSHLEHDYLKAHEFYENYCNNPFVKQDDVGRAALVGLYELYKWVWSVKDCSEFGKLKEHLKLLTQASPRINSLMPMQSPVTNKQDDKTNKFVEAIIGMFAVKVGENVDLDDPVKSSNGENPDVVFDYQGKRIAIACKTLRGRSERTIIDNLKSASKQINRANCDVGFALFNAMNILPHHIMNNEVYSHENEALNLMTNDLSKIFYEARTKAEVELIDLFANSKMEPAVLTFVHSVTKLNSPLGIMTTSLKNTYVYDLDMPRKDISWATELLDKVNLYIHNRL